MASANELIAIINKFSLTDRLKIIEEVLRGIREDNVVVQQEGEKEVHMPPKILELAGVMTEEEASVFENAIEESRKIDEGDW